MNKYLILALGILALSSCKKETPKNSNIVSQSIKIEDYEKYGEFHNKQVKNYLSLVKNSKSDFNLEDFYPILMEAISIDFNVDTSELPKYPNMIALINEFLDSLNTLDNVKNNQDFGLQNEEKFYFDQLDSLIFLALSDEDFVNQIESLELDIIGDNDLFNNSKDRLLISISIAKYSRELWIEQYQGNICSFPWGLIGADAGGCLLGLIIGGTTPYAVSFGVFSSLAYQKYSSR